MQPWWLLVSLVAVRAGVGLQETLPRPVPVLVAARRRAPRTWLLRPALHPPVCQVPPTVAIQAASLVEAVAALLAAQLAQRVPVVGLAALVVLVLWSAVRVVVLSEVVLVLVVDRGPVPPQVPALFQVQGRVQWILVVLGAWAPVADLQALRAPAPLWLLLGAPLRWARVGRQVKMGLPRPRPQHAPARRPGWFRAASAVDTRLRCL